MAKNKILNGVLVPMTAEEEVVFDADKLIAHAEIAAMQAKAVTEAEKKASGKQKLKDLGLDDSEILALTGN